MATKLRFSLPCPDGMTVFEDRVEVAGVQHHRNAAAAFAAGRSHDLAFEREPDNPHDANAIKVIGISRGWLFKRRHLLGYVPADTAASLAQHGLLDKVKPRLSAIWVGDTGYIVVSFDVLRAT